MYLFHIHTPRLQPTATKLLESVSNTAIQLFFVNPVSGRTSTLAGSIQRNSLIG
jgi:hypothetical protein